MGFRSDAPYRLRILHISDLHERGKREDAAWRRWRVLGEGWDANLVKIVEDGPIDLVCFTGDAANFGLEEEFRTATPFFTALLERLHLDKDRLFVVPGNHDVQRKAEPEVWRQFRDASMKNDADRAALSKWMSGTGPPPAGFEDGWQEKVLARQSAYREWTRADWGLTRPDLDASTSPHGRLGYRVSTSLPRFDFPLHVVGLDTAWQCGADDDATRLWLTEDQAGRLLTNERGRPLDGLRVVLIHHPFEAMADGAHCQQLVRERADLVLRGHVHDEELDTWSQTNGGARQLASGCLYEGSKGDVWRNGCHVATLALDERGRLLEVQLRFRTFSPRGGHWYDDDGLYKESEGGRLTLVVRSADPEPKTRRPSSQRRAPAPFSNPYDPWTPAIPPDFVGRSDILRRLEEAMEGRRSVSLVGDSRIGKTSILRTWEHAVLGRSRVVRFASGEDAEGVSAGALVGKITGKEAPNDPDQAAGALNEWARGAASEDMPPVVLVDEVDGLPHPKRFPVRFFERLRGMLGRVIFVFASRRDLDSIFTSHERTSPLSNRLQLIQVGLLEEEEARTIIAKGGAALAKGDAALMTEWAGRHPFYLQLLGRGLVEGRQLGKNEQEILDGFCAEAYCRLAAVWEKLNGRERGGLLQAAAGTPANLRSLRARGLTTPDGKLFGKVLETWLNEVQTP